MPRIGIIGGSGIYSVFEPRERVKVHTPYGGPSASIRIGEIGGVKVAFIPRHGEHHEFPPHGVPYRANVWALRELGVERLIGVAAVGSLREDYRPGDVVLIDQFIDFTKKREYTFYDGPKVAHVSMADPFCPEMREIFYETAKELGFSVHGGGTYVCIEGPRFSTRAESFMFRQYAHIIGMTLVPEVNLARELGMCYVTIATVTDYDVWAEKPVDAQEVLRVMAENNHKVQELLRKGIPKIPEERKCGCADVLKSMFV